MTVIVIDLKESMPKQIELGKWNVCNKQTLKTNSITEMEGAWNSEQQGSLYWWKTCNCPFLLLYLTISIHSVRRANLLLQQSSVMFFFKINGLGRVSSEKEKKKIEMEATCIDGNVIIIAQIVPTRSTSHTHKQQRQRFQQIRFVAGLRGWIWGFYMVPIKRARSNMCLDSRQN